MEFPVHSHNSRGDDGYEKLLGCSTVVGKQTRSRKYIVDYRLLSFGELPLATRMQKRGSQRQCAGVKKVAVAPAVRCSDKRMRARSSLAVCPINRIIIDSRQIVTALKERKFGVYSSSRNVRLLTSMEYFGRMWCSASLVIIGSIVSV